MPNDHRFASLILLGVWLSLAPLCSLRAEGENSVKNRIKIVKHSELQRGRSDDSEQYSAEKMEALAEKRRSLILDIKRFIREAHDSDQKAELNLRLGTLYMEDYRANLARAQAAYEQQNAAMKGKKGYRPPKFDNSEALASLEKARVIYKDLLRRYPRHPRRDEMYFFLAQSSLDAGKIDEGMAFFKRLSDEAPNSKYINDALVQLGDYYFDANRFPEAQGYYQKIVSRKYRPLIPYALYKIGWCSYNLQRPAVALQNWKWVVANEDAEETGSPIRIKNEALRDLPLAFVDMNMLNEGLAYFRAYGNPFYRQGLELMAARYYEKGEYKAAIYVYQQLVAIDVNYKKNPQYDISIVEALKLQGDSNGAVGRLFAQLPNYMKDSSWYEINAATPAVVQEAAKSFEELARKYAFQYHAEGQKTHNESLYNVAKQLYAKYLEFFPRTPNTPQVRFYLAEILYKQEKYVAASDQYYLVYKDPAAGGLRLDSIRYALSSLDRQLNLDRQKAGLAAINSKSTAKIKAKEDAKLEVQPYSEVERKFLTIATEYLSAYPNAKDAPDVLYEQAYLHYMHFELVSAYKSFWTLVQKYPAHPTSFSAAYLILDILNRSKDYPKLIAACQRFLQNPSFSKPAFRKEVSDILRHAELKRIQIAEEKDNWKEAADGYIEYTKAYGHEDEALFEKALYNASVDYSKAGFLMMAVETQEKFLRRFPKSNLRENMLLQVAKTYENLAAFDRAAKYYEMFATDYSRNAQAKNALRLAGLYYWGSGNASRGEKCMLTYLSSYPSDKVVEKDLISLYDSQNNIEKQLGYYSRVRAGRGVPFADYVAYTVKMAELAGQKSGRMPVKPMEEALKIAERHPRELTQNPKGVEAMSKLLFWFVKHKEDYFYSLKLAGAQKTIEANLQRKLALMKEMERDFGRVTSLGSGEWGLASMYKTAAAYHSMALDVAHAPVPGELSGQQVEQYRAELNKQMVKPFNEKALAMAAQCLDKAQEFNLLSGWTPKCYSLAAELQPTRYPVVRTFYLPPLQTALMMPPKSEAKISVGNMKSYAYPFFSTALFNPTPDRLPSSAAPVDLPALYDGGVRATSDLPGVIPSSMSYRVLSEERKQVLRNSYESEKPADSKRGSSFAFLNVLRLTAPDRAVPMILSAIQKDPTDTALTNLLGLAYLEQGNWPAAKITWLSLVARGVKNAQLWNNLGVLANMEGRESAAIDFFQEATLMESPREAQVNLGFIALKYRNGFEAKKHFEKALEIEKEDVTAQVGEAVAQLQNREMDNAKDGLVDLSKRYKSDPYARLSLGYFLLDVEKENDLAKRVLSDYMETNSTDNDIQFRQALQEAKRGVASSPDGLPSISQ